MVMRKGDSQGEGIYGPNSARTVLRYPRGVYSIGQVLMPNEPRRHGARIKAFADMINVEYDEVVVRLNADNAGITVYPDCNIEVMELWICALAAGIMSYPGDNARDMSCDVFNDIPGHTQFQFRGAPRRDLGAEIPRLILLIPGVIAIRSDDDRRFNVRGNIKAIDDVSVLLLAYLAGCGAKSLELNCQDRISR
jgi:hypothetical protein